MKLTSLASLINDTKQGRPRRVNSGTSSVVVSFRITAAEARAARRRSRGRPLGVLARDLFVRGIRSSREAAKEQP